MDPITLGEVAVKTDVRLFGDVLLVSCALKRSWGSFVLFTSQTKTPMLECSIVKGVVGKVPSGVHLREPLVVVQVNVGVSWGQYCDRHLVPEALLQNRDTEKREQSDIKSYGTGNAFSYQTCNKA